MAGNLAVNFVSKRTNHNQTLIPDKLFLSSLIANQVKPVFNLSRTYPIGQPNYNSQAECFDTIEITFEELSTIREDYEVTFVFKKSHNLLFTARKNKSGSIKPPIFAAPSSDCKTFSKNFINLT